MTLISPEYEKRLAGYRTESTIAGQLRAFGYLTEKGFAGFDGFAKRVGQHKAFLVEVKTTNKHSNTYLDYRQAAHHISVARAWGFPALIITDWVPQGRRFVYGLTAMANSPLIKVLPSGDITFDLMNQIELTHREHIERALQGEREAMARTDIA